MNSHSVDVHPKLRLVSASLHRHVIRTRMPFRFGIALMTEAPQVFLQARYEIGGRVVTGVAAEGLLPKWFDKAPEKTASQETEEMLTVIRQAVTFAGGLPAGTAFDFWQQLYAAQAAWAASRHLPPLLAQFGVSMVERSLLDALARSQRTTFSAMLRANLPGIDLSAIHPELTGHEPAEYLPGLPLRRIIVRHTVGLSDPLTAADLRPDERLDDGLPQTLEDSITGYGLRHFKIKLGGDIDTDFERLRVTARVITGLCGDNFAFTLDGNEQYREFAPLAALWERIRADAPLTAFFKRLLFLEQPFHRAVALDPAVARLAAWRQAPPVIIDESDAAPGDFPRALELGYVGTTHKNCKGVMKGVANRCLVNHRNAAAGGRRYQMSGEDLVNIGPVALLQDLAVQAALGNETVERNGHHYYLGLSSFSPKINSIMLGRHGDLFTTLGGSGSRRVARVDVHDGEMCVDSVNAAPFGLAADVPMDLFETVPLDGCVASA